ncbi:MAG: CRISPR-associated helicase Cas3' [bacterium]|nr:CRISPR-associated helicase Cas3' [bacterium]
MCSSLPQLVEQVARQLYNSSPRPFISFAADQIEKYWKKKLIFFVEAPTGYGKTTLSIALALKALQDDDQLKAIVAYPLRTLLEDQYRAFAAVFSNKSKELLDCRYLRHPYSLYLIKPVTLTTIDTLSLTLLGLPPEELPAIARGVTRGHYLFAWSSAGLALHVMDEAHLLAEQTNSLAFLVLLIKLAVDLNVPLVLISATLPLGLLELIFSALTKNEKDKILVISFSYSEQQIRVRLGVDAVSYSQSNDPFVQERLKKQYNILLLPLPADEEKAANALVKVLEQKLDRYHKVLVICNTVKQAVLVYDAILANNSIINKIGGRHSVLLLHSRFKEKDRQQHANRLAQLGDRYIVVATQVVEVGVNLTSDLLLCELCPAATLVQRAGRFLRSSNELNGELVVWYRADSSGKPASHNGLYGVYSSLLVERTLEYLQNNQVFFHLPEHPTKKGYKDLLDYVYDQQAVRRAFNLDINKVRNFFSTFLDLFEASKKALKLLISCGGSFVRDTLILPIYVTNTSNGRPESKDELVPLDAGTLHSLVAQQLVSDVIAAVGQRESQSVLQIFQRKDWCIQLVKTLFKLQVDYLVVVSNKLQYSSDRGLTW